MISYCKNGRSAQVLACPLEKFNEIVDSPQVAQTCRLLAKTDHDSDEAKRLKQQLPLLMFMANYSDGHRHAESAVPTGMAYLDLDGLKGENPREAWQHILHTLIMKELEGLVVLAHVSCSGKGLRIVYIIPRQFSHLSPTEQIDQSKQWLAAQLGVEDDSKTKDLARGSFAVPRDYIIYGSDKRMFAQQIEALEVKNFVQLSVEAHGSEIQPQTAIEKANNETTQTFKGIAYEDIISEWWRRNGGEPQPGERNVKLHKLAVNLRAICDNKREVLLAVMPRFGLSETEMKSIVDSACKEEPKGVSKMLASIIDDLSLTIDQADEEWDYDTVNGQSSMVNVQCNKLPLGLKESLAGVPVSMYMPVLCSVLPIAAAYADQVEVEYCDGQRQRLGLMSIIRGEQASGKSVCKNAVDVWKCQFDEEDALARKREEEWKERKKGRKANEKAPEDPKVLIRMVPVTVSCSTLLKRFKNSNGHTLYSFGEELDTLRKTNGAGSWSSKYDIYRLSFDQGEWGQDYNSDQAESGVVKVAYNWTMLGTDGAMRKCFKVDNIENGLSSRILVAEMPDSSFAKMPKFHRRSAEDEARIQEAVTRLRSYSGFVDTPRLRKAIETWVEQKRVEAAKDIDRVKDTYRKRAAVIGFRCGVVFHLLSGCVRESKACLDFALMMADYTLQQQIAAFGEALEGQFTDPRSECQRFGSNHSVYDQLPPTFSMGDLRALKRGFCGEAALRKIISRWYRDHWIEKTDKAHWRKVAIKQEQNDAHITSAEREQDRPKVKMNSKK